MAPQALVILGSGVTALAVAREARRLGVFPLSVDRNRGVSFLSRAGRAEALPEASDSGVVERLLQLAGQAPSALVATTDAWLEVVAAHRHALDRAFARVLHPPNEALATCLDKVRFLGFCEQHGLAGPRRYVGGLSGADAPRFPLILRPTRTRHHLRESRLPKAVLVTSPEELAAWDARFAAAGSTTVATESLLHRPLRQFSVAMSCGPRGAVSFVVEKLRPTAEFCAVGTYVTLSPEPTVQRLALQVTDALGYSGLGEVEVLQAVDTGQNYLVEVNPRPWLQYALAPASGHELLGHALGLEPRDLGPSRTAGLAWLDFRADAQACFGRECGLVRRGRIGLLDYLRSVASARVFAIFDPKDLGPWLGALRSRVRGLVLHVARRAGLRPPSGGRQGHSDDHPQGPR